MSERVGARHRTVIVGASIGGFTTAESLRHAGYDGAITLVGDEPHLPYQRPPLSKQVLTETWPPDDAAIATVESIAALGIDLVLSTRATGLEPAWRVLRTDRGELPYDSLVIATGVTARTLDLGPALPGVHTLRTVDDAAALLADLDAADNADDAARALVVGGGILGSEIAAGLRQRELAVTLAGRSPGIRFGQVGPLLSSQLAALHQAHGVRLRLGVDVVELLGTDRVTGAVLSDGSRVTADVVVAAVGGRPRTEWLAGAGLRIDDGVICDPAGRAGPDVYAVGDVARWMDPSGTSSTRVEHQQSAIEQAHAVAGSIATGRPQSPGIVPFFWSELYGTRIQAYGRFDQAMALEVVDGAVPDGRFVAVATADGTVTGVVGWNLPRGFRQARAQLGRPAPSTTSPAFEERQLIS